METLGFLISTFLLMIFLLTGIERQKWWIVLIVSVLTVLWCYVLFILCLHISLPILGHPEGVELRSGLVEGGSRGAGYY